MTASRRVQRPPVAPRRDVVAPHRVPSLSRFEKAGLREVPFGVQFSDKQVPTVGHLKPWELSGRKHLEGATRRLAEKEMGRVKKRLGLAPSALQKTKCAKGEKKQLVPPSCAVAQTLGGKVRSKPITAELEEEFARTIYVGSIPLEFTKKKVYELLGLNPATDVESIRFRNLPIDPKYRHMEDVAKRKRLFVQAKDVKDAYLVLKSADLVAPCLECNGKKFRHPTRAKYLRLIVTKFSLGDKFSKFGTKCTIFVGNLHSYATECDVWDMFEEKLGEGAVSNVRIMRDKATYRSKCCGFVRFKSRKLVQKVVKELSGELAVLQRPIHVTTALTKEDAEIADRARRLKINNKVQRRLRYKEGRNLRRRAVGGAPT